MDTSDLAARLNALKSDSLRTHEAVLADANALVAHMLTWLTELSTLVPGATVTQADAALAGEHRGVEVTVKALELHVPLGNNFVGTLKVAPTEVSQVGTFMVTSNRGGDGPTELFLRRVSPDRWCVTGQPSLAAEAYAEAPPLDQAAFNDVVFQILLRP